SKFPLAETSFCIAAIPASPLFEQVAMASLYITDQWENTNIIDNVVFPAHISFILSGSNSNGIDAISKEIPQILAKYSKIVFTAQRLYKSGFGFIGIDCAGVDLVNLSRDIISACSDIQSLERVIRPHLEERWNSLSDVQKQNVLKYGTYKIDSLDFHISIAQVNKRFGTDAFNAAMEELELPIEQEIASLQLVDVGHYNEQWNVIEEWKL